LSPGRRTEPEILFAGWIRTVLSRGIAFNITDRLK
jgi:hypothetical protein